MQKNQDQLVPRNNASGRPCRHESEEFKTIAWYSFLAGENSPSEIANWKELVHIDSTTIYRYRLGKISPSKELLAQDSGVFPVARNAYEIGPFLVPLWDAMWGELTLRDIKEADALLPQGDWKKSMLIDLLCSSPLHGQIILFRRQIVDEERFTSDLEVFAKAIRVCRVWRSLEGGNLVALRELLWGAMALPGSRGILAQYRLLAPMQRWIERQFHPEEASEQV